MESQLTSSLSIANSVANKLLMSAVISEFYIDEMGWRIIFSLPSNVSSLIGTQKVSLEESCDEIITLKDMHNVIALQNDKIRNIFLGKTVSYVRIEDNSSLVIEFSQTGRMAFVPAEFSPDWEWMILPIDPSLKDHLSIVSVHGEHVWCRCPLSLLDYIFGTRNFGGAVAD